jgi:HSP20 family molecular chaperone IbpA
LSVKTVDRKLVVHARHEEKTPGRTSCREFNREFDLPDNIDPSTVTASLGEDGCLVIEAPPPRP